VLADAGFETQAAASAEEALDRLRERPPALVVSDVRMPGVGGIELLRAARGIHPDLPFILVTAYADVRDAVRALKLGAVDYLPKPVDLDELVSAIRDALNLREATPAFELPPDALRGIVAQSPLMLSALRDAFRVAASDANVLLTGESGTGKEVAARFIHANSPRRGKPMVTLNCAAIPPTLLASDLFGHEKGAFTGAVARRLGRFREADGGTLFLDEIGDMPLELQPALLRAIEHNVVTPVGSDKEVPVDYRLIAATNRSLLQDVEQGRFRQDLYYRLNVIAIELPPLRDRPEDIVPLARQFLAGHDAEQTEGKRLSRAAMRLLMAHRWPGNVRELANAMEHARLIAPSDVVLPEHLPPAIRSLAPREEPAPKPPAAAGESGVKTLEESEIEAVRRALEQTGGNRTKAAELLGITRRGLIYKLKRLGLG